MNGKVYSKVEGKMYTKLQATPNNEPLDAYFEQEIDLRLKIKVAIILKEDTHAVYIRRKNVGIAAINKSSAGMIANKNIFTSQYNFFTTRFILRLVH